jgi:hypothetical protein
MTEKSVPSRIFFLIKVYDKEEHADAFLNNGEMFCRTLGDFKKIEDDGARGDAYEGVTHWHQPDKISLILSYKDKDGIEHPIPLDGLAGPVVIQSNGYNRLNLFCMYAVKIPEFEESYETEEERLLVVEKINSLLKVKTALNDEMMSLGEYAVVVYQVEDFVSRVKKKTKEQKFYCWSGAIKYYAPDTFHGSFKELESVFRKRNTYAHQNEYRFVFESHQPEGSKIIRLGSLDDIAFKVPTREFNEKVQLKLVE